MLPLQVPAPSLHHCRLMTSFLFSLMTSLKPSYQALDLASCSLGQLLGILPHSQPQYSLIFSNIRWSTCNHCSFVFNMSACVNKPKSGSTNMSCTVDQHIAGCEYISRCLYHVCLFAPLSQQNQTMQTWNLKKRSCDQNSKIQVKWWECSVMAGVWSHHTWLIVTS